MKPQIRRLHHVTATVGDAQEDLDCYVGMLGLRLVKKTVNFDNPGVYHFYYGDERGTPGTIMTTFPYKGKGVRVGRKGAGQITRTAFSVPPASLDVWKERLAEHGYALETEGKRFGEPVIAFEDPAGLIIELVGSVDDRAPWTGGELEASVAVRGVHSVTLTVLGLGPTERLLTEQLGLERINQEGGRTRFAAGDPAPGHFLDVVEDPDAPHGVNGLGTVHHVALAIGSGDEQAALRGALVEAGLGVTEVRDRHYFTSIYFREPGGILLEIATEGPGFLVDESLSELGQGLKLPAWEESRRARIEAVLPVVER